MLGRKEEGGDNVKRGKQLDKIVAVNYMNSLCPAAFGGIAVQKRYYGKAVDLETIKKGLSRVKGYTLKKPWEKRKLFNPTFVYKKRDLFQIDLLTVSQYWRRNGGIRYLLSGIDCFTRFAFVLPLKSKKGEEVTSVFENFLLSLDEKPRRIVSDDGGEFRAQSFQSMLAKYNIEHNLPKTSKHASMVERFNRTFMNIFSAFMETKRDQRYIDHLPRLIEIYNSRRHRSIGCSPFEAEKGENYSKVLAKTLNNYADRVYKVKRAQRKRWQRGERAIRIGDTVRVVADQEAVFRKGYRGRYEQQLFTVVDIDPKLIVPLYKIKRADGANAGEQLFYKFYREELQLVSPDITPQNFPSHQIIEKKGEEAEGGGRIKLRWTALPEEKFDVWMPLSLYRQLSGQTGENE